MVEVCFGKIDLAELHAGKKLGEEEHNRSSKGAEGPPHSLLTFLAHGCRSLACLSTQVWGKEKINLRAQKLGLFSFAVLRSHAGVGHFNRRQC